MKKTDKKWVMLCSTAVAAVYAAGYFTTEPQAAAGQQPIQHIVQKAPANSSLATNSLPATNSGTQGKNNSPSANSGTQGKSSNQAPSTTVARAQPKRMYKEGTFTGEGMNRRGTIGVQVTIKNDKITDVQISNFGMHYSESDVVGLPKEVIQKQSAQVDNVSGATYSTAAFADAVQQALDQAKNA
ncbi:FMN-binding protein [Neobacillus sp. SM06]|uniref:FMN-binding protein n=1 Tax=Neobacillus sp. SM06 TaxID=3422492 RepID=UPI003D2A4CF4